MKIQTILISVFLLFSICEKSYCQTDTGKPLSDSLELTEVIKKVITTYPAVKIAEETVISSDARISLAKAGWYPEADLTASFSNQGPVTKLSIPNMGTFQLFPENSYSVSLNYRQVIYDFGRIKQNIELETVNKAISEQTIEQVKQRLSMIAVNNYYSLLYLQAAINIKEEQITALNQHLAYVTKMMETGSATEYQVLATKVRISTVESQKVDMMAALTAQQASINSLIGNDQKSNPIVKNELLSLQPVLSSDSLTAFALNNRDEIIINQKRSSMAALRYGMIKLQNKPILSLMASGGAKNGYVPYLNDIRPNYVVGIGLRVPIFDGMKTRYNIAQAQSAVTSLTYESEITKRTVESEVVDAEAYMNAAEKKVMQFELQLKQALKAYSLAETSFKAGVITNLDLLDSNTSVSESRLLLLKAKIDYSVSVYKLKSASGEKIY